MNKITFIHPAIGHTKEKDYIKTWQMESLPIALIAGLTPKNFDITFFDDRLELIDFDKKTDLVAISIETYTAKRAYQIASEYRKRNIPVIMGGFHASLLPEEVSLYADSVVIGEAENIWEELLQDFLDGKLKQFYQNKERPDISKLKYNRDIFEGKTYLPIGLIETGRGCKFPCDFCAIQTVFKQTHNHRSISDIINELKILAPKKKLFFFVDDNFAADMCYARDLLFEISKLNIRWVTQMSINAAHNEEFLSLLNKSGCKGVLIGFESLNKNNLKSMNKNFNLCGGGYENAFKMLHKYNIKIYGTFVFGYDFDHNDDFDLAVEFAIKNKMYIAAFNHLTPFPGTPLYKRLESDNRLNYAKWWLDDNYKYNGIPFKPKSMNEEELIKGCIKSREKFYSYSSIFNRLLGKEMWSDWFMLRNFLPLNLIHKYEINKRNGYPLGDESFQTLIIQK